jgi:hypothetical protein
MISQGLECEKLYGIRIKNAGGYGWLGTAAGCALLLSGRRFLKGPGVAWNECKSNSCFFKMQVPG